MQKSQSAMEYLMTYGWAILIIAVVLGVMFQLGIFSGSALTPKAQPGSCQVQRLLGQTSLEGQCTGLLPQFVAWFAGSGNVVVQTQNIPASVNPLTITEWIYPTTSTWGGTAMIGPVSGCNIFGLASYTGPELLVDACAGGAGYSALPIKQNQWSFIAFTISSNSEVAWVNSNIALSPNLVPTPTATPPYNLYIGSYPGNIGPHFFTGGITNVQVYNASLSMPEVNSIYMEGIGGAPVRIQNLVGWWPLNGNPNDYSGNNNNGKINGGVSFNSTWNSQYTPP